jgi:hypothetical protein
MNKLNMDTVYGKIDQIIANVLCDHLITSGCLHPGQVIRDFAWETVTSTCNTNIIFTQYPERWIESDIHVQTKLPCKRAKSLVVVTSEPSARVSGTVGAAMTYMGSVNVVFFTVTGLLEQAQSQKHSRWTSAVNPMRVASLQQRVGMLRAGENEMKSESCSLADMPVALIGYPGTVMYPVGTVVRTPHTLRVVQVGTAESI